MPVLARPRPLVSFATVLALFVSGCAGDGASRTVAPSVANAVAPLAASRGVHASATRRTLSAPTCSGAGVDSFVGGVNGNVAKGQSSFVGGGQDDMACDGWSGIAAGYINAISGSSLDSVDSFIGGGEYNVVNSAGGDNGIVSGDDNQILGNAVQSVIGAGGANTISGSQAAILAGTSNTIGAATQFAVIGSGQDNSVTASFGFIGTGINNTVSGEGAYIAGGGYNTASGEGAVVDGGYNQSAAGTFATIPGGYENSAGGTYSFAAGARASAPFTGDFVWSDGSDGTTTIAATKAYQFLARASGGVTFYTNAGSTVGATLAAGSGTWSSLSDRNAKTNITPLDAAAVLGKVDALPISRWSYKSEHGVRHVGPMAQDFYAAFKVGPDDRHITSIDEDGVALAAIKALHADNRALHAENGHLRTANGRLRGRLTALETSEREHRAHDLQVDAELRNLRAELDALHAR
jgi:hypothetical protein